MPAVRMDVAAETHETEGPGVIYACAEDGGRFVKIGWAATLENAYVRWSNIQIGNPRRVEMRLIGEGSVEEEARMHRSFHAYAVRGEWFRIEGEVAELLAASRRCRRGRDSGAAGARRSSGTPPSSGSSACCPTALGRLARSSPPASPPGTARRRSGTRPTGSACCATRRAADGAAAGCCRPTSTQAETRNAPAGPRRVSRTGASMCSAAPSRLSTH